MNNKMKIFIGSSKEATQGEQNSLIQKIAVIVSQAGCSPVKWNKVPSIFQAGKTTIENLESLITRENIGASIFIFSDKDKSWERENNVNVPRSNVLFELGLFTAKLGRTKSIIIKDGNIEIPSDLLGVTYYDFSDETTAESNIQQWLNELKNTQGVNRPRISDEELQKIEQTKLEIEKELAFIKAKGLEKIFYSQCEAVADFRANCSSANTSPIKILCIRGESFVSNREENWGSVVLTKRNKTVILGNPNNDELITNRYNANKNDDEIESDFLERYREDMKAVQGKIKKRSECTLYLHNEDKLRFRMLFVDNYLYLSKFADTKTASKSEVIKIPKGYALYAVCEDHYNQILTNAIKQ